MIEEQWYLFTKICREPMAQVWPSFSALSLVLPDVPGACLGDLLTSRTPISERVYPTGRYNSRVSWSYCTGWTISAHKWICGTTLWIPWGKLSYNCIPYCRKSLVPSLLNALTGRDLDKYVPYSRKFLLVLPLTIDHWPKRPLTEVSLQLFF